MVSFQCHACGDVVKKPKLDQHRTRCHSGYDCIDCSTTFNTPGEYKSHTSCISEAEKYQKSLYKGSKTGDSNAKVAVAPKSKAAEKQPEPSEPAAPPRASNAQWKPAPQKEQWGVWGRGGGTRMTGANDTPLGANNRPDPSPKPVAAAPAPAPSNKPSTQTNGIKKDSKRKAVEAEVVASEAPSNKKGGKSSTEKDVAGPSTKVVEEPKKEKKSKKDKKTEKVVEEVVVEKIEKESKKEKKEKKEKRKVEAAESNEEESKSEKKEKKRKRVEEDDPMTGEAVANVGEEKKKKKKEKREQSTSDTMDVDSTSVDESVKKKEKKAKKEKKGSSSSS